MSSSSDIVVALKAELKSLGMTYAELARGLGLAESSVKRMFAKGDMPLSRLDEILRVLKTDFSTLVGRVKLTKPVPVMLTLAQEREVVADPRRLLVAICCLSQWSLENITHTYQLSEAECVRHLVRLDKLGVIELRPGNRYRLLLSKSMKWQPRGPIMEFFRRQAAPEYFSGSFDGPFELLSLVHGRISAADAALLNERLARVVQDFAQQHLADQKLPEAQRLPFTLVLGMRSWWFKPFEEFRR